RCNEQGGPMNTNLRLFLCVLVPGLAMAACGGELSGDQPVAPDSTTLQAITGNGAPSGTHFHLNILGVPQDKSASLTGGDGQRIFVPLFGSTKIMLSEGDFAVLDANGPDGSAAFQLPNPDPDGDGITQYSVFARALGTPGGSSKTTTCATDPTTGELVCSVFTM